MSLVDFFDKRRYWGTNRNHILQKLYFYAVVNRVTNVLANIILPIYFKLTGSNPKYSINNQESKRGKKIIVSLTSFPVRLPKLWMVVECIMRQTVKPDAIILYLTEAQITESLPGTLTKLKDRGLQIVLCPDSIRSHTKYYYALKSYPNDIVITVDDDLFYRSDLIESLLDSHKKYPNAIVANWAKEIIPSKPRYAAWPDVRVSRCADNFLLLGVSGILYPGNCLYQDLFDVDLITSLSLTADDVWLSCMALLQHTPIYFTGYKYNHLSVSIKNNETLISGNYVRNQEYVEKLNEYYNNKLGVRPFIDIPQNEIYEE